MSKLNPNAYVFVPSFSAPATPAVTTPAPASAAPQATAKPAPIVTGAASVPSTPSKGKRAKDKEVVPEPKDVEMAPTSDRIAYPIEYLRQFQLICDAVPCHFPDVVRAPPPQRLGRILNDRLVYSVPELLQFQHLYTMPPQDFEWTETRATPLAADKAKTPAKSKKEKAKARTNGTQAVQYDPGLVCYFNPTEYAAALDAAMYSSTGDAKTSDGNGAGKEEVNPVEEAIAAKRRVAPLLDDVRAETITSIVEAFDEVRITCIHTLQEVIGLLFDHAIAAPDQCESYAQLCSSLAERTPEFKDGAKTINFRRILLTRCYEALIEEPEAAPLQTPGNSKATPATAQHSWRRQCMLGNVCLIGELFRRQLLTENIMHVCVAMMLEDEVHPQMEIIEAACRLLSLVGDLLDGSSPASRRTMDEYFDVLQRLADHVDASQSLKELIADTVSARAGGWTKKRQDGVAGSPLKRPSVVVTPVNSPPRDGDMETSTVTALE
ncbi:hypothetical protein Poli38472_012705 [Pythium oligandrum]|uniref:MIF4G domain-containing protein n=1 Tax=Pythium oligandrum TaxID=41045 RepID=A0A8K1FHY7_PYTOL|nr:hypothetical protein Poli38472_012705 [Pythium oligandrum]|eukprot:TMW61514.1 hypothetical protein Poli38472_012705 [Pythium oligandrum]